jgi:NAD(P)-dependent dehydrogenase (short-subunit alcohol dehydrogenase family)
MPFPDRPRSNAIAPSRAIECKVSDPCKQRLAEKIRMPRFAGKNAVIVGGTSGIGLEAAIMLHSEGVRILVTGRTDEGTKAAAHHLGSDATIVKSDMTSLSDLDVLASRIKADLGTIDALLVCAGLPGFAPFEAVDEETYDRLMTVNAKGPYFTVQKLAPVMAEDSGVVILTSVVNVLGTATLGVYSAAKAALRSMTRSMARELLPHGIRVNAVSPGAIDTPILGKIMPKEAMDDLKRQSAEGNPMKRVGRPEEIAKAMIFFAFDATYTTGAELAADGGATQL